MLNDLKAKVDSYECKEGEVNWPSLKEILQEVVNVLQILSANLPASLAWLSILINVAVSVLNIIIDKLPTVAC